MTIYQFWTSIGSLIGAIVDNFTSKRPDRSAYLIPLGLIFVVPLIITVGLFFIPESPRWLLLNGKRDQAHAALVWLRPDQEAADREMAEIEDALNRENELARGVAVLDMFRNPIDRRRTILSVCAISTQAASGAMYLIGKCAAPKVLEYKLTRTKRSVLTSTEWPRSRALSRYPAS